jgi:hypothetical protein
MDAGNPFAVDQHISAATKMRQTMLPMLSRGGGSITSPQRRANGNDQVSRVRIDIAQTEPRATSLAKRKSPAAETSMVTKAGQSLLPVNNVSGVEPITQNATIAGMDEQPRNFRTSLTVDVRSMDSAGALIRDPRLLRCGWPQLLQKACTWSIGLPQCSQNKLPPYPFRTIE